MFKKNKWIILLLLLIIHLGLTQNVDSLILNVEDLFINNQSKIALKELTNIDSDDRLEYRKLLSKTIQNKANYSELLVVFKKIHSNHSQQSIEIKSTFDKILNTPSSKTLNIKYVKVKWELTLSLLNAGKMKLADSEYKELVNYVDRFKPKDLNFSRAHFYLNIYQIIMAVIGEDLEKGIELSNKNKLLAYSLKDTNLMVMSDYYYSDFILIQGNLDDYIDLCNKNIKLSKSATTLPEYYYNHIFNLLDALIYKKGSEDKALKMLNDIYNIDDEFKIKTYSYYLQLVKTQPENSKTSLAVYHKFKVSNLPQLCDTIIVMSKQKMENNDLKIIYKYSSLALYKKEYYKEAILVMNTLNLLIEKIYTTELSQSLALNEVRNIESQKKYEINLEKQKTEKQKTYLYAMIAFFILAIVSIYFQIIKNKKLSIQKKTLAKSANEKQLLLKEIHHRVKNNFQIVSSLLQLQIKDIDDVKALNIVKEGQNRVKSMALIHQKLYQNDDLLIDLKEYVKDLFTDINNIYSIHQVDLQVNIASTYKLDIDTVIPLGLILNELITNAFKYGFETNADNNLTITIIENEILNKLIVTDNGKGIPNSVDLNKTKSIGLKLVKNLAKQLHGNTTYKYNNGAQFTVTYKETFQRGLVE